MTNNSSKHADFAERLSNLMKQKKLEINDIVAGTGITYEMIRRYKEGLAKPREEKMSKLADFLDVSVSFLAFGKKENVYAESVTKTFRKVREVPVLSWVQAGVFNETGDLSYDKTSLLYDDNYPQDVYWLEVKGDSMEPKFCEGDLVLIDPHRQAKGGDFVIARDYHSTDAMTLKKLRTGFDDKTGKDYLQLVPLNPDYAIVDSRYKEFVVQGVVLEKKEVFV